MIWLSATCAALAVLTFSCGWPVVRLRVNPFGVPRRLTGWLRGLAAAFVIGTVVLLPGPPTLLAWTAVAVGWVIWRRLVKSGQRKRSQEMTRRSHLVLDVLVSELRSGAPAQLAATRASAELAELAPVATAAITGGDIAAAFTAASRHLGAHSLALVGQAWAVSDATGAPLESVLDRVRSAAREDLEIDREVAAAVAPARATATLMIALPPLGLAMGSGLGVDPLSAITGSFLGATCVALGTGFALLGITWIDRVADRLELSR